MQRSFDGVRGGQWRCSWMTSLSSEKHNNWFVIGKIQQWILSNDSQLVGSILSNDSQLVGSILSNDWQLVGSGGKIWKLMNPFSVPIQSSTSIFFYFFFCQILIDEVWKLRNEIVEIVFQPPDLHLKDFD